MLKYLFALILLAYINAQNIKDIAYASAKKHCPISTFEGLSCPIKTDTLSYKFIKIIGGLGFDTIKQTTRLPILKSGPKIQNYMEQYEYFEYSKVSDFIDNLYNNKNAKAGMYSHKEGADELFKNFYNNNMKGTLAQKIYTVYQVNSENTLDEYFQKAIELLPAQYDENLYNYIIEFWGDSVLMNSSYGGVFENQRALRECFNAEVIDVQKNVESIINSGSPSKDVRYLDYSLYSTIDIIGGNPEITDTAERIKSFKLNPVFIYGTKYPIWQLIPEGIIRDNMKFHLESINKKINDYLNELKNKIKQSFLDEAKKEHYKIYSQYYAVYDFSKLTFPQYWNFDCRISRYDCYNCKETYNKERSGYSRACVVEQSESEALMHLDTEMMGSHYILDYIVDNDGYYQHKFKLINQDGGVDMDYESEKIRSGCIKNDERGKDTQIIPGLGWKFGLDYFYCLKCTPWINYIQEWGQTQEYFQCSCPKTI